MRPVITIALYDLLRTALERSTFVIGLAMPAVMILLLGLAMGGADDVTIRVDVLDEDGSDLSTQFVGLLEAEIAGGDDESFLLCDYADPADGCDLDADLRRAEWRDTADTRLEDTDSYGAIIITQGFGENLRAGRPVTVQFKNSADLSAPTLIEQKIDAAVSRMNGALSIATLVVDIAAADYDTFQADMRPATFDAVRAEVEAVWDQRPVLVENTATSDQPSRVGVNQSGPGIALMFVLLSMLNSSTILVYEREIGTLQRLFTLPHRKWQILGGKLLHQYLYGLIQFTLLVLVGVIFGVEWGGNVPGLVLIILTFTLTATALGMALATLVRTSAQASNISLLLGMTLAPLGGAWWPLEIVPDFMQTIGHLSPIAWGMDAFQELMFYGGGVVDILPMLGVLLGMAAALFVFGVVNFRYE